MPDNPGGLLYTYASKTTNLLNTYQDAAGLFENTNPIVLDENGEATIYCKELPYTFLVTDAKGIVYPGYPKHDINPGMYGAIISDWEEVVDALQTTTMGLQSDIVDLNAAYNDLALAVDTKANMIHTHTSEDIEGLQSGGVGPSSSGTILSVNTEMKLAYTESKMVDFIAGDVVVLEEYGLDGVLEKVANGLKALKACIVIVHGNCKVVEHSEWTYPLRLYTTVTKNGVEYSKGATVAVKLAVGDVVGIKVLPLAAPEGVPHNNEVYVSLWVLPKVTI